MSKKNTAMSRHKVYVTRRVPQPGLDLLRDECDVTFWDSDEAITKTDLIQNVRGIDGLFCLLTDKVDKDVIEAAGKFDIFLKSNLHIYF